MFLTLPQDSQVWFGEIFLPRLLYMARKKNWTDFSNSKTPWKERKSSQKKKLKDSWVFFNITIPGDTIMCFGYCYVKMVKFMTGLFLKYSTLDNLCCMRKLIYSWIHLYSFLVYAGTDKPRWQNRYPKNGFTLTASLFGWTPTGKEIQFR